MLLFLLNLGFHQREPSEPTADNGLHIRQFKVFTYPEPRDKLYVDQMTVAAFCTIYGLYGSSAFDLESFGFSVGDRLDELLKVPRDEWRFVFSSFHWHKFLRAVEDYWTKRLENTSKVPNPI